MKDAAGDCFILKGVRYINKQCLDYVNGKAKDEEINVLQTPLTAYEICARLAAAGLPGKNREA